MEIDNDMKWTCQHSTNQTKLLRIFFFQKILNIWYIYQYLSEVQCTKLRYVKKTHLIYSQHIQTKNQTTNLISASLFKLLFE